MKFCSIPHRCSLVVTRQGCSTSIDRAPKGYSGISRTKGSPFETKFTDKLWIARLYFLADKFAELNSGIMQLQGRNTTVITAQETATAFLGKLQLWIRRLEKEVVAQFHIQDQFVEGNNDGSLLQANNKEMSEHFEETWNNLASLLSRQWPRRSQFSVDHSFFSVLDDAIHDFPAKEEWSTM